MGGLAQLVAGAAIGRRRFEAAAVHRRPLTSSVYTIPYNTAAAAAKLALLSDVLHLEPLGVPPCQCQSSHRLSLAHKTLHSFAFLSPPRPLPALPPLFPPPAMIAPPSSLEGKRTARRVAACPERAGRRSAYRVYTKSSAIPLSEVHRDACRVLPPSTSLYANRRVLVLPFHPFYAPAPASLRSPCHIARIRASRQAIRILSWHTAAAFKRGQRIRIRAYAPYLPYSLFRSALYAHSARRTPHAAESIAASSSYRHHGSYHHARRALGRLGPLRPSDKHRTAPHCADARRTPHAHRLQYQQARRSVRMPAPSPGAPLYRIIARLQRLLCGRK
ncbi:hypothetical protein PYCCODRAFT_527120 [Trametes coccinea BRFM310]|uniref:Uncharacterized protein n=1 Tax=Trametes coccinea (strain BRFM310) TaxID=1353009 RepID=A0A1Y2IKW2_TRAC3|nr:hypothetical protein PYCCODRAFT_527120 [Trametes coccinea BRFM310]